jgi:DNA-binding XRE family transcriptional regulator
MEITEKLLLDNYDGITHGLDYTSIVCGTKIWWNYRKFGDGYHTVCKREHACEITFENDRVGTIPISADNNDHPSLAVMKTDYNNAVGTSIKETDNRLFILRTSRGITQRQLADAAGINIRTIQKLEAGDRDIAHTAAATFARIAEALGVTADKLL